MDRRRPPEAARHAGGDTNARPRRTDGPGKNGRSQAATANDGHDGGAYRLARTLAHPAARAHAAELRFTAPAPVDGEKHRKGGAEPTLPVEVDGRRGKGRRQARGSKRRIGILPFAPGARPVVKLRFVNRGNLLPPTGFRCGSR